MCKGLALSICIFLSALCPQPARTGPPEDAADIVGSNLESANAWGEATVLLAAAGFGDLAVDSALTAARLDGRHVRSLEDAALLLDRVVQDFEGAIDLYARAAHRGSAMREVFYGLGNLEANRGNHAVAALALRRATECDPGFLEAFNNLANAHLALGNAAGSAGPRATAHYRKALESLAAASALDPTHRTPLVTALMLAQKTADFRFWENHTVAIRDIFLERLSKGDQVRLHCSALELYVSLCCPDAWRFAWCPLCPWCSVVHQSMCLRTDAAFSLD